MLTASYPEFCEPFLDSAQSTSSTVEDAITFTYVALFALSVLGLIFIASTIVYNDKLQTHPQPLIATICIAEACMSYNALMEVINPVLIICYFSTYRILGYTLFKDTSEDNVAEILAERQCQSNSIFYAFFQLISLMLNLCLCIDLILTIYDPFSPAGRRLKWYYLFSVTASVCLVMIIFGLDRNGDNKTEEPYDCINNSQPTQMIYSAVQDQANLVLAMTLSLYIVVAIYSTVYSYRRLHRPGVSAKVRSLFVKKHFLYVVVFIIIWMIQQSNNYYNLFNPVAQGFNDDDTDSIPQMYGGASPAG